MEQSEAKRREAKLAAELEFIEGLMAHDKELLKRAGDHLTLMRQRKREVKAELKDVRAWTQQSARLTA